MNVNKVILVGNITRDPELKALPSGQSVCSFSMATNEVFKDASGQKQERTEFHNVVAWGKTAENIAQYMKKGSQIYIEGKLQTRSWDDKDSGKKMYRTEINALNVQFGAKPNGGRSGRDGSQEEGQGYDRHPLEDEFADAPRTESSAGDGEINPEDIPF